MRAKDARYITLVTTLRLFLVCVLSAAITYATYLFGTTHMLVAYTFALCGSVAVLTFPPLLVFIVASACRRPIGSLPRWLLITGALAAVGGLAAVILIKSSWTLILFASGFWLMLLGLGAIVARGLLERWSQ